MPRVTTQKTSIVLSDLKPCESYLISVGIVGPKGPGPLGRSPLTEETAFNEDSPPRNVQVTMDARTHELSISWENNCPVVITMPTYIVSITELTTNVTATAELRQSGPKVMTHKFIKIPNGAVFNVSVKTKSKTSQAVVQKVYAPALPAPRQLKVYPEKNGTYVIYWKEVTSDEK